MFTLFNLHSLGKYYRKRVFAIDNIQECKNNPSKNELVIPASQKNVNIRYITVLKVVKRYISLVTPQINHKRTENTKSHQTTRTRIQLKILE